MTEPIHYQIAETHQLTAAQKSRMFSLMQQFYVAQEEAVFLRDLALKQYVILLATATEVQGFSTVAINPGGTGTADYQIYYSGDTILHPDYWGSQELVKGFFDLVSRLHRSAPQKKLYWFLLSKGHRTYLYLPLFFKQYYPGVAGREDASLQPLLDHIAQTVFGQYWQPAEGIIQMPDDRPMVDDLKEASYKKQANNEHIQFFLQRNPGFEQGAELACLVDLSPENYLPLAVRIYRAFG